MINFLSWILFGLVVGVLAKFLMPGKDPGGFIITVLLGIAGAVLGGWVTTLLGMGQDAQSTGWIMSIIGAMALLAIYRMAVRPANIA